MGRSWGILEFLLDASLIFRPIFGESMGDNEFVLSRTCVSGSPNEFCSADEVEGGLASMVTVSVNEAVLMGVSKDISSSSARVVCFSNSLGAVCCRLGLSCKITTKLILIKRSL